MTQGMADMSSSGNSVVYKGGLDALRTIVRVEGVRGLYRGFSISLLTYAPSSATWWSTYGASQQLLWRFIFSIQICLISLQKIILCVISVLFTGDMTNWEGVALQGTGQLLGFRLLVEHVLGQFQP